MKLVFKMFCVQGLFLIFDLTNDLRKNIFEENLFADQIFKKK